MWIALAAALQAAPSRWDGVADGSWVDYRLMFLRPTGEIAGRIYREQAEPGRRPQAFTQGLEEVSRSPARWKDRPCQVVEFVGAGQSLTAWVVEGVSIPARQVDSVDIPPGVVRALRILRSPGRTTTIQVDVDDLQTTLEISGRRYDCVVETSSSIVECGTSRVVRARRRWLSAEVPGHLVRQERQCTNKPEAIAHQYDTRDDLVDFHLAR